MSDTHCKFGCDHERHQKYKDLFKENVYEQHFLWQIAMYVWDSNISADNADDLDFFQDLVFESSFGRIHIFFYEKLFQNYYRFNPNWVITIFARYLVYLEKVSVLFTNDAFDFIFRQEDPKLILALLKEMPFDIKLRFVKVAEQYPAAIQSVPKLKMYNLFS